MIFPANCQTQPNFLLGPAVAAVRIRAHVVQSHLLFGSAGLRLEEDRLSVGTLGTGVLLGSRQRRIRYHVRHDVGQLAERESKS